MYDRPESWPNPPFFIFYFSIYFFWRGRYKIDKNRPNHPLFFWKLLHNQQHGTYTVYNRTQNVETSPVPRSDIVGVYYPNRQKRVQVGTLVRGNIPQSRQILGLQSAYPGRSSQLCNFLTWFPPPASPDSSPKSLTLPYQGSSASVWLSLVESGWTTLYIHSFTFANCHVSISSFCSSYY